MCILCKNKKTNIPTVNTESLIQTDVDRSGLSNVYNIYNEFGVCDEVFKNPLFYMDGAVKATTGYTTSACSGVTTATTYSVSGCSAVYNLSEIDDFDLTFNITGNTEYTGYTGNFCYHTFPLIARETDYVTKNDSVLTNCFNFFTITSSTVTTNIGVTDLPREDKQYFIKDFNKFRTKNCFTKLLINTFDLTTQPLDQLYDTGWYFTDKPLLLQANTSNLVNSSVIRTEIAQIVDGQTSTFQINGIPLNNKMVVYVNGIQLTEGPDWETVTNNVGLIRLKTGVLEPNKDVVMIMYLDLTRDTEDIFNLNEDYLNTDAFIVSTILTGATSATTVPLLNYNSVKNRQEVLLTKPIKNESSLLFVVNGVTLNLNIDFYFSSSDNKKLIMDPKTILKVGDAISTFYLTDESAEFLDVGIFRTLKPTLNWFTPETYQQYLSKNGKFLLQVTTSKDTEFSNPIQQIYVDYIQNQLDYSQELLELPTDMGENFIFRVYFFKDYPILFNNIITTRNVSETGSFRVNINYAKNSY
jgi:hypothetical protein